MKKIAVFQENLSVGGIQKSLINLLKNLDYSDLTVDLYLMEKSEFWNEAVLPEQVRITYIKPLPEYCKLLPFGVVKKYYHPEFRQEEYDLSIDFNSYQMSCAVAAIAVPAKKRVMWIHNNVEIKYAEEWKYRALWNAFKGKFEYFDGFVPCSAALEAPFRRLSGVNGKEFWVIQNYIDVNEIRKKALEVPENLSVDNKCLNFVAVGKLCHQKGYDLMLDAFAAAYQERKDIRLYILGDGPDREKLLEQRNKNGLNEAVFFMGNQSNPFSYMQQMDAFISMSRYEGQPLNIMEARAVGLPLYCSKNLEQYSEGLRGYEDIVSAICDAKKQEKHPDDLLEYNKAIIEKILSLVD